MTVSERLDRAGSRILHGDDSIAAAQALEAVLLEEYTGDERVEELLAGLTRYGHEDTDPYSHAHEVRRLLMDSLERMSGRVTRVELSRRPQSWAFRVFADDDEKVCGILPGHPRDFGAAREALVAQLRREYPRVRSLRWSAVDNDLWAGHLPGQV